jgi:hypothetical protein
MREYREDKKIDETAAKIISNFKFPVEPMIKYLKLISDKSTYLGKCSLATGKWKYLIDKEFVIEVWEKWWEGATDSQKEALLFHELSHIDYKDNDDGEVTWRIKDHDVEEFNEVAKRYGDWNGELTALKNNFLSRKEK